MIDGEEEEEEEEEEEYDSHANICFDFFEIA